MTERTQYDVFLSHNSADKSAVEYLAQKLQEAGLVPFLDKWHLIPGEPWQEALEEALDHSRTCAVFLGLTGLGPWENEEMRAVLEERVRTPDFRVIPVLLPDTQMPERGRLPRFLSRLTWVDFRKGLIKDEDAFYRLTCGIRGIPPGAPGDGRLPAEDVCPYRGLQPFQGEHAEFFFGREALTQWLVEGLRGSRFLAVIGPSGSGKSSVVRAGLIPTLRQGALPESEMWTILVMTPGARPLEELAAHLAPLLDREGDHVARMLQLQDQLQADQRTLHAAVRLALVEKDPSTCVLIIVDQFEELFTLCQDEEERQRFLDNLLYASGIAQGRTMVVIAMRADFYARAAAYPELADRMADHQVLVTPMEETELRQAIEAPAQRVDLTFDNGLVDTVLADVLGAPGALPLMEHALLELWRRRQGQRLTFAAYWETGGVGGAIARRAEEEYGALPQEQRETARRILLRLVQPGEGTEDTRRRATFSELIPRSEQASVVEAVIERLADARLLTTSRDTVTGEEQVDVAHEALIRGWPRLQRWIDEDRTALRTHRRLTDAALEWEQHRRDESYVYRGVRLAEAEDWRSEHEDELNQLEREFLDTSKAQQQRDLDAVRELERLKQEVRSRQGHTALGRLAGNIAHHVKNQVGIIRLSALALLDDHELVRLPSRRKTLERILRNAEATIELSNTLLQPFIQNPPEWCDVNLLLQVSMNLVGEQAEVDTRVVLATGLPEVYVEPQGTANVFQELIINSLKAIEKREPPRQIEVITQLAPDGWVEVLFSNSGPPIPKDQWELIFERFTVGKPRNGSEGFGLGLWSARLFARRQGGEVYLLESNDIKTTFVIRLPTTTQAE